MERIAATAGVTKPILYRHFRDRTDLCRALGERYTEHARLALSAALAPASPRDRLAATIDTYLAILEGEPEAYRFVARGAADERSSLVRRLANEWTGVLRAELARAGGSPRVADAWAHGIVGMLDLVGDWWIDTKTIPRHELVEQLTALLWNGLSSVTRPPSKQKRARR